MNKLTEWIQKAKAIKAIKAFGKSSPNEDKAKNTRTTVLSVFFMGVIGMGFYWLLFADLTPKKKNKDTQKELTGFARVIDPVFTDEDNRSALTGQQSQINELESQIKRQKESLAELTKKIANQSDQYQTTKDELEKKLLLQSEALKANDVKSSETSPIKNEHPDAHCRAGACPINSALNQLPGLDYQNNLSADRDYPSAKRHVFARGVESFRVVKETAPTKYQRSFKNYIPTGTFCKAIVLGGADASAAVDAQGEAAPMLFKVMESCFLPNGKRANIKGAMITASVYGKISSERGMVRLEHLSLVRKDGTILEVPVEGTAFDVGGKNGIRGIPVMRNDKVIANAGLSGMLSGLGNSAQQYSQTQSVSPLGQTTSIKAAKILPNALGAGASTAFGEISKYYIELAKQYSPVIQLNAGAVIDVVFLKGFPLEDEAAIEAYEARLESARAEEKEEAKGNTLQLPKIPTQKPASDIKLPSSLDYQPANA